jgi:hypothetical protein
MKTFGEGSNRVTVRDDGKVVNSVGHVYETYDEALGEAYDLERERFYFVAENLRSAVRFAKANPPKPVINDDETKRLDRNELNDEMTDAKSKYDAWVKHMQGKDPDRKYDTYW